MKHGSHGSRRVLCGAALGAIALVATPRIARADSPVRLVPGIELGGGTMLTPEIRNRGGFNSAFHGSARLGLSFASFLSVQLSGSGWLFPSSAGDATVFAFQAGVRLHPSIGDLGWLLMDLNGGVGLSGSQPHAAFDAGLGFEFSVARWLALGPVVRYARVFARADEAPYDAQFWSLGLSFALRHEPAVAPAAAPIVVVRELDTDHDGVADTRDRCPRIRAGAHPDPFRTGCPEEDFDRDGVIDHLDWCRVEPAGPHPDLAWPGCPLPDEDNDGVPDRSDPCPRASSLAHPDPVWPGCPLRDEDHDGVADDDDLCPSEARGAAPDPDRRGCPDGDRDRDGALDHHDECPAVSAGLHPDLGRIGCPQSDVDHDSVPDVADRCPTREGTPSTIAARNGCAAWVTLRDATIETHDVVSFSPRTATLRANAVRTLAAVVEVMRAAPEIHRLTIRASADDASDPARVDALARLRVETVRYWLIAHGVEASRLAVSEAQTHASGAPGVARQIEFRIADPALP